MPRTVVYCKTQVEGYHRWPDAQEVLGSAHRELAKVLSQLHRHMFHCTVAVEVSHTERDVEFVLLKRLVTTCLEAILTRQPPDIEPTYSCERLCLLLHDELACHLGNTVAFIQISEDDENGAIVDFRA